MKLRDLLKYECSVTGDDQKDITGITYDSRCIEKGFIFAAIRGEKADGHDFIEGAVARGAVAIICENGHPKVPGLIERYQAVSWVEVDDCRDALAAFSSAFYRNPSGEVGVIGITGTNGKTTTSYLVKSILEKWDKGVGLIGTIRYMIKDRSFDAPHTTPEASDFQRLLREMADEKCDYVVTEVSSHAISQKRTGHTQFRVAVFTNLTRDHLDFHGTMEEYYNSKAGLFLESLSEDGTAVINVDDPYGRKLSEAMKGRRPAVKQITFSLNDRGADVSASDIKATFRSTSFNIKIKGRVSGIEISSPMVGQTSVYNILAAVCAVLPLNVPDEVIRSGVAAVDLVKGRFERVDLGQPFLAVVDYAHTDDALERLLLTARQLLNSSRQGKIITVFGCGGNRDRGKRPKMGSAASGASDFVIVTSDNPRHEDPTAIIRDIETGIGKDNYIVIQDRRTAIRMAVLLSSPGDVVVVAGKGHEDYQEIGGVRHPFSDRKVLEEAICESTVVNARGRSKKRYAGVAQCLK
ncbi:MAG TPA: UDP-N-acetylmuramoyl-L-alanyl-D-glutamate--2,6-diaminopimelate ligase [Dissulfurispiraceae bacterium]|nr:UDP-N-acetylmuramoyl-L-alanyl-D-glutamate--2,6-diaminopimelate ligase [Dissulfurispiraceae bacterium]